MLRHRINFHLQRWGYCMGIDFRLRTFQSERSLNNPRQRARRRQLLQLSVQ